MLEPPLRSRVVIPTALFIMSLILVSPLATSQSTTGPEGPGETWELPTTHNLFLKGDLGETYLDRNLSLIHI